MKKNWKEKVDPKRVTAAYHAQIEATEDQPARYVTDSTLALAWIYGDVVHASADAIAEAGNLNVRERYRAAAPLVARIAMAAVALLNVIKQAQDEGLLELSAACFEEDVVVGDGPFEFQADVKVAPVGTPMPAAGEELGPEWQELRVEEDD